MLSHWRKFTETCLLHKLRWPSLNKKNESKYIRNSLASLEIRRLKRQISYKKPLKTLIRYIPANHNRLKGLRCNWYPYIKRLKHNEGFQGILPLHSHLHWWERTHSCCESQQRVSLRYASLTILRFTKSSSSNQVKPQTQSQYSSETAPTSRSEDPARTKEDPVQQASQESKPPHIEKQNGSKTTVIIFFPF